MIIYKKLDESKRVDLQKKLADCNKILDQFYCLVNKNCKINKLKYFKEILHHSENNPNLDFTKYNVVISNQDIKSIVSIKEIEVEIFESLVGLIHKIIKKYKNFNFCYEDLQSEGYRAILESIPYYLKSDIKFSTYFYICISRKIKKFISTELDFKNKQEFNENILIDKNYRISGQSKDKFVLCKNSEKIDIEKIRLDEFSPLELVVLEGFIASKNKLGIGKIAKEMINPKTNKPYSRMAISYAWKRVKNKIIKMDKVA